MVERKKTSGSAGRAAGNSGGRGDPAPGESAASATPPATAELRQAAEPSSPPEGALVVSETCWIAPSSLQFTFSRSSGPGGQAVNKVSTRAQLRIALNDIVGLSDRARGRLKRLAGQRLTVAGEIVIQSDVHRSQRRNRGECEDRLRELIAKALIEPRKRKKTKPSKAAIQRRLTEKKHKSEKKQVRRRVDE